MRAFTAQTRCFFLALVLAPLITGCAVVKLFKASEAKDAGFIENPEVLSEMPERSPFHRSWVTSDRERYDRLKQSYMVLTIRPVDIGILRAAIEKSSASERNKRIKIEEIQELSNYFRARLLLDAKELKRNPPLMLRDDISASGFAVELALVEVEPTSPIINLAGTAAGALVPGGGLIKVFGTGSIAFEGRIKDGNTGEILEQFKDREKDKQAPFTVKDFQRFAHLRVVIDEWSKQIVETVVNPVSHKVDPSLPFTINPL